MSTQGHCPACKCNHPVPVETAGKVAGTAVGALLGRMTHKSAWAPLVGAVTGIVAGEIIDRTVMPRCPTCRTVLQLIGTALT
jgi:outer membrane lipoprotein SlyB